MTRNFSTPYFDYLLMLRGVCAIAVISRHYPFEFLKVPVLSGIEWFLHPFGYVPVLLFFCLSGFLVTRGFVKQRYDVFEPLDLLRYYRSRALRVLPLYYLSIAFCFLLYWPRSLERLPEVISLLWFAGAYKVQGEIVFNHVYWTLPIEIVFFALAPLVFLACSYCYRRLGAWGAYVLVVAAYGVLSASLFGNVSSVGGIQMSRVEWNQLAHQDLLYNFEAFLLGALAALHVDQVAPLSAGWQRMLKMGLLLLMGAILMRTGLVGDLLFEQGKVDPFTLYLLLPVIGLWFLGFAILYASPQQRTGKRPMRLLRRRLEALGHCSYGLYLLHMPMLFLIERSGLFSASASMRSVVALLGVIFVSALAYRFIERPMMRLRTSSQFPDASNLAS